ncbi:ATP-grasp domain-containing protein [Streptomyces sp. NPDC093510]|uniref:ATP-grasp domain-containing protein n=1 Tax=Streptomyces sp. NPDC093510 TaxID=3155199 RepID=UPI00341FE2EC
MKTTGTVLVVGSGVQEYREDLLRSAALRAGLWLLDAAAPTWQAPHLTGSTRVDPGDINSLIRAARSVAEVRKVRGVLCYEEALILPAAQLAEALGVPGPSVTAVRNCRDKHRTRALLRDAGLPQPRHALVADLAEAAAAAEWIGYPVVVKPRGLGAGRGVALVRTPGDLRGLFADARAAHWPGVPTYRVGILVEEYLEGPEVSVDGVVHDGRHTPLFVARKLAHEKAGPSPYFEESGHMVSADDPLLHDPALRWVLDRTHRVLGVTGTVTHTQVRMTARGFVVIEVNGRPGGDLIPHLGSLATGIDPGLVAVDVALRTPPDLTPDRTRTAGIRFLHPTEDCRVEHVAVPGAEAAEGLLRSAALAAPGDELRLPPSDFPQRYAYVLCEAGTPTECAARLDAAAGQVRLAARPLSLAPEERAAS